MAVRQPARRQASALRAQLAERLRARARDLAERMFDTREEVEHHVAAAFDALRADQLDAEEPVEVQGWELRSLVDGIPAMRSYVLDPEGALDYRSPSPEGRPYRGGMNRALLGQENGR